MQIERQIYIGEELLEMGSLMSGKREEQMEDWENEYGGRGWNQTEVVEHHQLT